MFTDRFKVVRTSSRLPAVQLSPVAGLVCWTSPVSMITGTIKLRSPHQTIPGSQLTWITRLLCNHDVDYKTIPPKSRQIDLKVNQSANI